MKSRCPVCRKLVETRGKENGEDTRFFPFCCERCKLIDLGAWLDARYRITSGQQANEAGEPSDTHSLSSDSR